MAAPMQAQALRGATTPMTDGSRTLTINPAPPREQGADDVDRGPEAGPSHTAGVLRLRGMPPRDAPRVQWDEEVVDNEGMGKKKSKICCIYHKPRPFDESSSSSSSSSSDAGEDDGNVADTNGRKSPNGSPMHPHANGKARKAKRKKRPKCEDHDCQGAAHRPAPNAYECDPAP